MTKLPTERDLKSSVGFVEPNKEEFSAAYADLSRRWKAGEIALPTFGEPGFERAYFRHRALLVAAGLIARGLCGEAAVDHLRRTEPRLLGFYEGRAALALVDAFPSAT